MIFNYFCHSKAFEYEEFGRFKLKKSDFFLNFVKFPDFFHKPHFYLTFPDFLTFAYLVAILFKGL